MTDVLGTPEQDGPAPLPVEPSPPQPAPLGVPVRKKSKWPIIIAIGIVVLLIGTCVGVSLLIGNLASDAFTDSFEPTISPAYYYGEGSGFVAWSGEGRYAVVQYFDEDGVPVVAVWDKATEETRTQAGYLVVGVESAAPQVWLTPCDQVVDAFDSLDDPIDHKPEELLAWKLDAETGPSAEVAAKWRAWEGPGAYTAYLEIDPLKGCMPAKLLINNNEGSGEGVKAQMPESTTTFAPVGFSPSGEYFAVEELVDGDEYGLLDDFVGLDAPELPDRKLLVFSAESGELVAEAVLPAGATEAPMSLWGSDDTLYWADMDEVQSGPEGWGVPEMWTLRPGQEAEPASSVIMDGLPEVWTVLALGTSTEGAHFAGDDGTLWRLSADGLVHLGNMLYADSADFDAQSGLLSFRMDYEYMDDETDVIVPRLYLLDERGGSERQIWEGPRVEQGYEFGM